jgi:hypothetical protein
MVYPGKSGSGGLGEGRGVVYEAVLDSAAEDQQASVLTRVEWERDARSRFPAEAVRLIVVTGAYAILAANTTVSSLWGDHRRLFLGWWLVCPPAGFP